MPAFSGRGANSDVPRFVQQPVLFALMTGQPLRKFVTASRELAPPWHRSAARLSKAAKIIGIVQQLPMLDAQFTRSLGMLRGIRHDRREEAFALLGRKVNL